MKKIILIGLVVLGISTAQAEEASLVDELKDASAGSVSTRFKGGYYMGIGYQGRVSGDGDTRIQGLLLEGGLYMLFNPVRNFFDIEVGVSGKYNTGMSSKDSSGDKEYYAGLKQGTVYAGLVFRRGDKGKGFSLGVSKAFTIDEVQTDEMKADNMKKHDIENGIGIYGEYQTDELGGITFTRVEIERIDIVGDNKTDEDIVASILFGIKY